jgi:hypothetical protein
MIAVPRTKSGNSLVAFGAAVSTAGSKRATRRKRAELRDSAGDRDELPANDGWRGRQEALRIGMLWRQEDVLSRALFNDTAGVHDGDAISDLGDYAEIVSDEEESEFHFAAELVEQFKDLFLNGDIESGCRFIGNQQFGIGGERHGDHDALAKSAGELMRKLPGADVRIGHSGSFEGGVDAALQLRAGKVRFVSENRFLNLLANTHHGIQRGHGLLENHGDFAAADGAPVVFLVELGYVFWRRFSRGEQSFTRNASAGRKQAHQSERKHGLAAAGFADKTERFAGSDAQGNVANGTDPAGGGGEFHGEGVKIEKRAHVSMIFVSTESNRQKCSSGAPERD